MNGVRTLAGHSLSATAAPLLRLAAVGRAATDGGSGFVELDVTGSRHAFGRSAAGLETGTAGVSAIWLPLGRIAHEGLQNAASRIAAANVDVSCGLVVFDAGPRSLDELAPLLPRLADWSSRHADPTKKVLVGLRANHLEGGRLHLVKLRHLRRLVEEWDVAVAIDLAGPLDVRWEAEAALLRLGSSLRLLRVGADALQVGPVGRARVSARAVAAALELRVPPHVAIVPRLPLWKATSQSALARAYADAAENMRRRFRHHVAVEGMLPRLNRPPTVRRP